MWRKSVVGTRYEKYKEKEARLPSCGLMSRISSETSVAGADTEVSKDKIRMVSGVQNQTVVFPPILGTLPSPMSEKGIH